MSRPYVGDVVVLNTPNPLYRGIVAKIIYISDGLDRDRQCVQVGIACELVYMPGIGRTCEWVRPSQITLLEDLERAGGCEG